MNFRNAHFNSLGTIDCEVEVAVGQDENGPIIEWWPYTISEAERPDMHAAAALVATEYVPPDPPTAEDLLEAARDSATLERREFCLRLFDLGVLPAAESVMAAKGEWAPSFAAFLDNPSFTEREKLEFQTAWATAQSIAYTNDLLQALALVQTGGDVVARTVLLDAIFGVS